MTHFSNRNVHGLTRVFLESSKCVLHSSDANFPVSVIVIYITHTQCASIITRKEHFVRARIKNGGFVGKCKSGIRSNLVEGRIRTDDVKKCGIENLEERGLGRGRVEELRKCTCTEWSIGPQDSERVGIDELGGIVSRKRSSKRSVPLTTDCSGRF